jgi:RNA polymerase sigma-70 factor (ECF subfamily)
LQFESLSDEYLAKLAARDEDAAAHFVRYFGTLLVIKLRARFFPPPLIDELCQETIVRVLTAIRKNSIQDARKLGSFVVATCNHVVSEHFRSDLRSTPLEDSHLEKLIHDLDIEKTLLTRETQQKVRQVLARLPERDRKVLTALFLEERDKDLICKEFGIDRGYLRVLLHRAKSSFRGEWSLS